MAEEIVPIPGPRGYPIVGNITDVDPHDSMMSYARLANIYGEIFKLNLAGNERIFVSSQELVNEVCDEKRFAKAIVGGLTEVRKGLHDGLFTSYDGERNWGVAHRILMPAFGPLSIRNMFDEMHDIATQLALRWARFGPDEKINVTEDFTRLTLDTIALCAMGARFNSFYKDQLHPFVGAMMGVLTEAAPRSQRPALVSYFMPAAQRKFNADVKIMRDICQLLIDQRKAHPTDKKDLLNAMIKGRDPKTGEAMSDDLIMNNMATLMIAGHETTSGLLSFLFYYLLKDANAYQKARAEVDNIAGTGPITADEVSKFVFIQAAMRETLRLCPPVSVFSLQMKKTLPEDQTVIGGKYLIKKGQAIMVLNYSLHRDPAVYGDDADLFKPERMEEENFKKLPPNAWKPFGNGVRGCIGSPFAWEEATLAAAMLLQTFDFSLDDPSYTLQINQAAAIKPKNFFMRAALREGIDLVHLERRLQVDPSKFTSQDEKAHGHHIRHTVVHDKAKKPIFILFGSNAGTCEALAHALAREAGSRGYEAKVQPLDAAADKIPKDQPVILISSSYEGQPPDNAAQFCSWLETLKDGSLKDVKYAVYGCGNHDWANTFFKIPKFLDTAFTNNGATRITTTGLGDVSQGDIFESFDRWQDDLLWPALGSKADPSNVDEDGLKITIDTATRSSQLRQNVQEAIVRSNTLLTEFDGTQRRHIELQLPTNANYQCGDYISVLPINNSQTVRRVLKRFGLPWDAFMTIEPGTNTTLPTGHPVSAMDILGSFVELSHPATTKNATKIANSIPDEQERKQLLNLISSSFEKEISAKRLSPLDLLEAHPAAEVPFASFLDMLPSMRVRQYSISSSPLAEPTVASITWTVLDAPSKGSQETRYLGVASNYLATLQPGDHVHIAIKPSLSTFHLPANIEQTPLIMLCAGSGLAPFRGFIQERSIQAKAGRKLAEAHLFIGCRNPEEDMMFADELAQWEKDGIVKLHYAFSRVPEKSNGAKYVQDRFWDEREEVRRLFGSGAKVFICGSAAVGEGVSQAAKRMHVEYWTEKGVEKSEKEAEDWFQSIKGERYATDVFV